MRLGQSAEKKGERGLKQLCKRLATLCVALALCCGMVPAAHAADASYYNVYLESQGGSCEVIQLYAYKMGSNYRLTGLPTPTMEGYRFDGWYDDIVGGSAVGTGYDFKQDTTIYARWTPSGAAKTNIPVEPAQGDGFRLKDHLGTVLITGAVVTVVALVASQAA